MSIASQVNLTDNQLASFDRFLVEGTDGTLEVLESMFGLDIESSNSSIEIAPPAQSEHLRHLGNGPLYTVASAWVGDMEAQILLLMRPVDFEYLSEAMRPVLSLLFLSSPDADLETLNRQLMERSRDAGGETDRDSDFRQQMMAALEELANVLIGLYSKAIYHISNLNTRHSIPHALKDPDQRLITDLTSRANPPDQPYLVIENEFVVMDRPIRLWCLIAISAESFREILQRIG